MFLSFPVYDKEEGVLYMHRVVGVILSVPHRGPWLHLPPQRVPVPTARRPVLSLHLPSQLLGCTLALLKGMGGLLAASSFLICFLVD